MPKTTARGEAEQSELPSTLSGRSWMTKDELVEAIQKRNRQETRSARE
ncbi:hypothetical protein [Nocardia amamiensis]|nr:hypothetical protein [Nocardia amamiensis]